MQVLFSLTLIFAQNCAILRLRWYLDVAWSASFIPLGSIQKQKIKTKTYVSEYQILGGGRVRTDSRQGRYLDSTPFQEHLHTLLAPREGCFIFGPFPLCF